MNIDRPWNIQSQVHCILVQSKNDLIYISQSIYYHSNIAHCVKKKRRSCSFPALSLCLSRDPWVRPTSKENASRKICILYPDDNIFFLDSLCLVEPRVLVDAGKEMYTEGKCKMS